MKKWFKFFSSSFFSHNISKEAAKRGYTNAFLGFVLALMFLWSGFVLGDMLPFGAHYNNAEGFSDTVQAVLANPDLDSRIEAEIEDGVLKAKKHGGEYTNALLVNSLENDADKQKYSKNGYDIVVDMRPADVLAEVEAYCVSNDGKSTEISYAEYLTLSEVARLNFDFKLRYTGNALELTDEAVESYLIYINGLSEEIKSEAASLSVDLSESKITKSEYMRAVYELYFTSYYPDITEYESTSKVPLLRNYYYHQYISRGAKNYLFIFDDYIAGSFETKSGIDVSFYGFYSDLDDGALIGEGSTPAEAARAVDDFVKKSYGATGILNLYAYAVNTVSLLPFIALMLLVAALLTYSVLRLRGVESIVSFGAMFKIVGSYVWFCGVIAAVFTVIASFFVQRNMIIALPLVSFFAALAIRSLIFALKESRLHAEQSEQPEQTEV